MSWVTAEEKCGRSAKGEETMSDSTRTIKHIHIRIPGIREAKGWAEKVFSSEKTADAALLVMAVMLCGWLLYCLARPFADHQLLF